MNEDVKAALAIDAEARRIGAAAERDRIRREFLTFLAEMDARDELFDLHSDEVRSALDRICPEEP